MSRRLLVLAALLLPTVLAGQANDLFIDHRYASERQYTLLCFPFDWQKTIILGNGHLAYDFGPGPYHAPGTEIGLGRDFDSVSVRRQFFADPGVPVATTEFRSLTTTITQVAFSVVPASATVRSSFTSGRVRRLGHLAGTLEWADPPGRVDPAFRNVAWGTNRPIRYRVRVERGSTKIVALGVCESYKSTPGQRVLELRVEGAPPQILDPMKDGEKNRPYLLLFKGKDENGDGELAIEAHSAPESPDPNVILNAFWIFPEGTAVVKDSVLRGGMSGTAEVYWKCGTELSRLAPAPRTDAIIATYDGPPGIPAVTITTRRPIAYDSVGGIISLGSDVSLRCNPSPRTGTYVAVGNSRRWIFPLPYGTQRATLEVTTGAARQGLRTPYDLDRELRRARRYWKSQRLIPRGKIVLPDSGLQRILDVNIRNLYQAADLVDGFPVFQPGPTVYRGLFLLDILLIGEPLLLLGDTTSLRRYIEGTFRYQQPDGRVRVVTPYNAYLETPAFVHALGWFARRTNNRQWMEHQWLRMVRGVEWIRTIRGTTMRDSTAVNFGLFPPGFVDGGLGGAVPDFSTATFALTALETAIETAQWLGHTRHAREWQHLFEELMTSYTRVARKNLLKDRYGTVYLPVTVGDTTTTAPPQRGQYGFLMALRYGKYFSQHNGYLDSLVAGNLAMLDSTLREGMVVDAGWTKDAVWSWFGMMHAVTLSWAGQHQRAAQMVYDVANHAGWLGTWVEEQQLRSTGTYSTGDGSNAETSAYFITAVRHLLLYERGDTVEILPGVPAAWYRAGARIRLRDVPSALGRFMLEATVSRDGNRLQIAVSFTKPVGEAQRVTMLRLPTEILARAGFTLLKGRPLPSQYTVRSVSGVRLELHKQE